MTDDTKQTFPMMPASNWWDLRTKFSQSMPKTAISTNYIETVLNVTSGSARNILYALVQLSLLDDQYVPTDLAERWRHDDTYSDVCKEIRDTIYPEELLHAAPNPTEDRKAAERWFAGVAKVGTSASKRMAQMYQLLMEADPALRPEPTKKAPAKRASRKATGTKQPRKKEDAKPLQRSENSEVLTVPSAGSNAPPLHIDIQIHIDSAATPEQIDKIFESMAKHIYKNSND